MYRFLLRPRWLLFHLLIVGAIVAMINLGFWQLRRLDERREFNDVVTSRYDQPAAPLDVLLAAADGDADSIEWRPADVTGEYLPDEEIRIVNRSQAGRAGENVVTPLRLDDGRILLVNRGFVPLDTDADQVAGAPTGDVTVTGRVRPPEERRRGQVSDPGAGELTTAQRVDIERLTAQLPGEVVPVFVDLADTPGTQPFPEPIAEPELTEGPHLGYAVQWYVFSVCAAIGWLLAVRHSANTRRQQLRTSASATDDSERSPGAPTPALQSER